MALIQDAVLGLLAKEPSHGYALWQQLQRLAADPDAVQSSSVYMAVKRLADAGAIEPLRPAPAHGSGERPRFTFGLTDAGRGRWERWRAQPPSSLDDLRLRIALAEPLDDLSPLIDWVAAASIETQQRLGAAPGQRALAPHADPWAAAAAVALSALEFRELSARAQWLAEAHAQLQALRALAATYPRR